MFAVVAFEPIETEYLDRFYTELLSPERFLEMYEHDRDNIESAHPVPAPLGSKVFGYILVRRKHPVYPLLPPRSTK